MGVCALQLLSPEQKGYFLIPDEGTALPALGSPSRSVHPRALRGSRIVCMRRWTMKPRLA